MQTKGRLIQNFVDVIGLWAVGFFLFGLILTGFRVVFVGPFLYVVLLQLKVMALLLRKFLLVANPASV